jgi:hypothetical protein
MRWGLAVALAAAGIGFAQDDFLTWDAKRAQSIALGQRVSGKVGGSLDLRVVIDTMCAPRAYSAVSNCTM